MPIVNLFSKRQRVLRKEVPDVYEYTQIPEPLRVQITHILHDLFGHPTQLDSNGALKTFGTIENTLCREYGFLKLPKPRNVNPVLEAPGFNTVEKKLCP